MELRSKLNRQYFITRPATLADVPALDATREEFIAFLRSLNPLNLVNPVQNPVPEKRREYEPKSTQTKSEPPTNSLQINIPKRTKIEPKTTQSRHDSEPTAQNRSKKAQNRADDSLKNEREAVRAHRKNRQHVRRRKLCIQRRLVPDPDLAQTKTLIERL
jgi:hypothetical protein